MARGGLLNTQPVPATMRELVYSGQLSVIEITAFSLRQRCAQDPLVLFE